MVESDTGKTSLFILPFIVFLLGVTALVVPTLFCSVLSGIRDGQGNVPCLAEVQECRGAGVQMLPDLGAQWESCTFLTPRFPFF